MDKIKFLFAVHNHQPVGNFEHVFEEVFQKCYRPYFEVLRQFLTLKTSVHFSGPLLEWLKKNQPDYLKKIRDMVQSGQLEIMSGGFYEPLLATLPEEDAIGQIRMMNEFIRDEFGMRARGLWLAERIWTPELPRVIAEADIEYTVVDDTHFYYAGLEEQEIHGYYITERLGSPLLIFPISKALRYAIPFRLPEETLEILRRAREDFGFDGLTYADDGEKFGSWPETYQWVYNEKWLEKFFTALRDHSDHVETVTFSEFIDRHPPTGRVYLPMASYDEMMEWSLPTRAALKFHDLKEELKSKGIPEERYKLFLRGGQWDNFLTKYEESNNLHKKMLRVSQKVRSLDPEKQAASGALRELYRAQCNCAQWHGLFGGLYLNYLRHALHSHLISAENIVSAQNSTGFESEIVDFNLDGRDEVLISNPQMNAFFSPGYGGSLMELDYRPSCFNVSNVLRRREETYHRTIRESMEEGHGHGDQPQSIHERVRFKEADLQNRLFFDRWERYSFLDHFMGDGTTLETFSQCRFEEQGDFTDQPFVMEIGTPPPGSKEFVLHLTREGTVAQGGTQRSVAVEKTYFLSREEAQILTEYRIINKDTVPLKLWWGLEFNFTLLAGDAEDRYYFCSGHTLESPRLNSQGILNDVETIGMRDDWFRFQLALSFSPRMSVWRFPVETISQSEDGFERTYQGSCMLAHRVFELEPGQFVEQSIRTLLST